MMDVGDKEVTLWVAVAEGWIYIQPATLEQIVASLNFKGDVLGVVYIAGIMCARRAADPILLYHQPALTRMAVGVATTARNRALSAVRRVETFWPQPRCGNGSADPAVQVVLPTCLQHMCKAVDRGMIITDWPAGKDRRNVGNLAA